MTTTFRADVKAGIGTMMQAYIAANPTLLKQHHDEKPAAFTNTPCSYLSTRDERVAYDQGTRERVMSPSVTVVKDGRQTVASFDALVDSLMDHFQIYPHIVAGTIWDRMTVEDYDETIGEQLRPAVRFTFANLSIQEGRT